MCLKRKVCNKCVMLAKKYENETWKFTKRTETLLRIALRTMERAMLAITMRDSHSSTWMKAKTGVKDKVQVVKKQKWRWAGHIARMKDNRWTKRITDLCPYNDERSKKKKGLAIDGEMT